jgi:hypothetical protein
MPNIIFYAYSMDGDIIYTPPQGVKPIMEEKRLKMGGCFGIIAEN